MKVFRAEQIKQIDNYCISVLGIPSNILMENAAFSVISNLELHNNSFVIVCGVGNNGGDGLAVARQLIARGIHTSIFVVGNKDKGTEDFKLNKNILEKMNQKIYYIEKNEDIKFFAREIDNSNIIIDSIFGIGLTRNIEGVFKDVIQVINSSNKKVIAIDIPSGVNSDTGEIMGIACLCDETMSFVCYKHAFLNSKCRKYIGKLKVENIGIPDFVLSKFEEEANISDKYEMAKLIPTRDIDGHKGTYGKVAIIAGSKGFTGAAYITTEAAIRAGSGLVTLCTDEYTQNIISTKLVEAMTCNYNLEKERFENIISNYDCIAIGPGLGNNEKTLELLKYVLKNHKGKIIIDADGLNVLKDNLDILNNKEADVVITPHPGEMARLINKDIAYVNDNRLKIAYNFSKKYNITVLLKGHNTVITKEHNNYKYVNFTGNSAMASGGMGDCLTGIIASFMGQGLDSLDSARLSAYLHGLVGDKLSKDMYAVRATNIIENISKEIKTLEKFK